MEQLNCGTVELLNSSTFLTFSTVHSQPIYRSTVPLLNCSTDEYFNLFNRSPAKVSHRQTVLLFNRLTAKLFQRLPASTVLPLNSFITFNHSPPQPFFRLSVSPLNGSTAQHVELLQPFSSSTVPLFNCSSFNCFTDIQGQHPQPFTSSTVPPFNFSTVQLFHLSTGSTPSTVPPLNRSTVKLFYRSTVPALNSFNSLTVLQL